MGKAPLIVRPYDSDIGLTGESAYQWTLFLANEADLCGDYIAYDKWKSMAEGLAPKEGKAVPAAVHYPALENAIEKYANKE
tara:strand:- start:378 stop:620 length:243 start_codon:yes stop_codon:yes gene_type:complete